MKQGDVVHFVHVLVMNEPEATLTVECQLVQRRWSADSTEKRRAFDSFPREQTVSTKKGGCNPVAYVQLALVS